MALHIVACCVFLLTGDTCPLACPDPDFACHLAQMFDYNAPVTILGLFAYRRLT